jgi:HEPN domain-containing protein
VCLATTADVGYNGSAISMVADGTMMDISKQVEYWQSGAQEDWEVGCRLVKDGKTRHGLFFAHLALEKVLKAHVCRHTKDVAPRLHNLVRLGELAGLAFDQEVADLLADMNQFHIEGRYPESGISPASQAEAEAYVSRAGRVLQWLMTQL